jgi:hypothetical protein
LNSLTGICTGRRCYRVDSVAAIELIESRNCDSTSFPVLVGELCRDGLNPFHGAIGGHPQFSQIRGLQRLRHLATADEVIE